MRFSRRARLSVWSGIAAVALMVTAASVVPAAPLDQQTCDQLKREVAQLEGLGARDNLGKGAAWGKANLRSAQLEQVKKLIEMDEAIAFRCPIAKPEPSPSVAKAKGKATAKAAAKMPADGAKGPAAQARPKPKPKPKATAAAADGASTAEAPRPQAKPKPPAPKRSDAYKPPPKPAAQ